MNNRGFTLTEMVVSMGIAMILLLALCQLFISQDRAYSANENEVRAIQKARSTMNKLVREIRMAGYNKGVSGIQSANGTTLRFWTDINVDGIPEDVTVSYNNNDKTITRNGVIIIQNVEVFSLIYTLSDGTALTTPPVLSMLRKIKIRMDVRTEKIDVLTKNYKIFRLDLDITPRNLSL